MQEECFEEFSAIYKSITWHEQRICELEKIVASEFKDVEINFFDKDWRKGIFTQNDTFLSLDAILRTIAYQTIEGYREEIQRLKNSL